MTGFDPLLRELDAWHACGRVARLWWRDDDATQPTPALRQLLLTSVESGVAPVLAAIPFGATAALAETLARQPAIRVWQHGVRHHNAAAPGRKKQELVAPTPDLLHDLTAGRGRLSNLFGAQMQPMLVPPWNRIGTEILPHLPMIGFSGISTFKPRQDREAAPRLMQINTHVDLLDWQRQAAFRGTAQCVADICAHLVAKRHGTADSDEPTGVLTHHAVMRSDAWDFLNALFAATNCPGVCQWAIPAPHPAATDP